MSRQAWLAALLIIGMAIAGPAWAQAPAAAPAEEAAIRALEERVRLGVLARDTNALREVWAPTFAVNAPINRVTPSRAVVFDLLTQGLVHYSSYETTIEFLRVDGPIAVVMGAEVVRPTGKAPHAGETLQRRYTHVWRKDDGRWLLIARHANIILTSAPARGQ
jgi:ketosteroid isomerase-like protein